MDSSAQEVKMEPKNCDNLQELRELIDNRTEDMIKAIESLNLPLLAYIINAIRPILQELQNDDEANKRFENILARLEQTRKFVKSANKLSSKGWTEDLECRQFPTIYEECYNYKGIKHLQHEIAANDDEINRLMKDIAKKRILSNTLITKLESKSK